MKLIKREKRPVLVPSEFRAGTLLRVRYIYPADSLIKVGRKWLILLGSEVETQLIKTMRLYNVKLVWKVERSDLPLFVGWHVGREFERMLKEG